MATSKLKSLESNPCDRLPFNSTNECLKTVFSLHTVGLSKQNDLAGEWLQKKIDSRIITDLIMQLRLSLGMWVVFLNV